MRAASEPPPAMPRWSRRRWPWLAGAALLLAGTLAAALLPPHWQRLRLERRLLAVYPQDVSSDPALVHLATVEAKPLIARYCAACHGVDLRGNPALGVPDLTNGVWLWGSGTVFQIERIILYGIRSGHGKALNTTDMPAYGLMGRLNDGQIGELVQYLRKLNGHPYDAEAANAGQALFRDPQVACFDCHGNDAAGVADYGAPNLTLDTWSNGGDPRSLYDSIFYGRHRIMPAWVGTLSLEQIRALAVYLHTLAHPPLRTAAATPGAPRMP